MILGRKWFKAEIEKRVEHRFNERIERLRADLRTKEAEISALRDGVLGGRAQRQALLDRRRLDSVERIWSAVAALAPLKFISSMMAVIKFEAAAKAAVDDPNVRKFFQVILKPVPDDKIPHDVAQVEQPFASPLAWAYFSAYRTIVVGGCMRAKLLTTGMENLPEILDEKNTKKLLKVALPHQAEYIDKYDAGAYNYLLDEL